jgi:hypothetical protein
MNSTVSEWHSSGKWQSDLSEAGFSRNGNRREYIRDGVAFEMEENWPVLSQAAGKRTTDPLNGQLGQPGLWKRVVDGGGSRWLFEIPPMLFMDPDLVEETDAERSPIHSIIEWAMDTRDGGGPGGWSPPAAEDVAALIPRDGLTVQRGAYVLQGRLEHESGKLALRIPIVSEIPEDLSLERRSWLSCLLTAAQNKWRLVRLGIIEDQSGQMVSAEIDLTGIPHPLVAPMMSIALPALRNVAEWVVEATVFLTTSRSGCRALEAGAARPCEKFC